MLAALIIVLCVTDFLAGMEELTGSLSFIHIEPSQNESKGIQAVPKKLFGSSSSLLQSDQFKVFLRLKPNPTGNKTHIVLDNNTLLTEVPTESVSYKVINVNSSNYKRRFAFTSILDETTTQNEVFRKCVLPSLMSFIKGEDWLVMAYGTTSAGKTFTMQGTAQHPGIIPRALSYLFRSLEGVINQEGRLQPYHGIQLLDLDDVTYQQELAFKNRILGLDLVKYQKSMDTSYMPFRSFSEGDVSYVSAAFAEIQNQIDSEADFLCNETTDTFSVWVSMIEIYNETLVELLQFPNKKGETHLILGEDDCGGFYVKNAKQVHVRNGHEAYQVMQFGRTNLQRAPTALNDKSSRSHCIFTVTLVRHHEGTASLNRFSFVDLAGSERAKKTLNSGKRLIESNSINKSLCVLGKCLHAMKENQKSRSQLVVPVRESKMTLLFKNALLGTEKLTFIINISTDPLLYDETMHVLKFSAIAHEIIPEVLSKPIRLPQFPRISRFREPSFPVRAAESMPDLSDVTANSELLQKRLAEAEDREFELESDLEAIQEQYEGLYELHLKEKQQWDEIWGKMSRRIIEITEEKRYEIDELKKGMEAKHQKETEELDNVIHNLKTKIKNLKKQLESTFNDSYEDLVNENEELRSKIEELCSAQNNKEELIEQLKKDLQDETFSRDCLEAEKLKNEELNGRYVILEEQLEAEKLKNEELNGRYAILEEQLEAEKLKNEELNGRYVILEEQLDAEKLKNEELNGRYVILEEQLEAELLKREELEVVEKSLRSAHEKELEASQEFIRENDKLSQEIHTLKIESEVQTQMCNRLVEELKQCKSMLMTKENQTKDFTRATEISHETAYKKLAVPDYPKKLFFKMMKKSEEISAIPDLKETVVRLENELKNKQQEFQAFEIGRDFLFKHLKNTVVTEIINSSAQKSEIIRLHEELRASKERLMLLENNHKEGFERSPLRNRTNIPITEMVQRSPFYCRRVSKSEENIPLAHSKMLALHSFSAENLFENLPKSIVPEEPYLIFPKKEIINCSDSEQKAEMEISSSPKTPEQIIASNCDNMNSGSMRCGEDEKPAAKSTRKTAKMRDPLDHPALSKSTRGRRRCGSPDSNSQVPSSHSVKKKLFSSENFVELSDDSDFLPPASPTQRKRLLRPRGRRLQ